MSQDPGDSYNFVDGFADFLWEHQTEREVDIYYQVSMMKSQTDLQYSSRLLFFRTGSLARVDAITSGLISA